MEASQSDRTLLLLIESDHSVSHREPPTDPDTLVASGTLFSPAEECICHAMGVSDVIWGRPWPVPKGLSSRAAWQDGAVSGAVLSTWPPQPERHMGGPNAGRELGTGR